MSDLIDRLAESNPERVIAAIRQVDPGLMVRVAPRDVATIAKVVTRLVANDLVAAELAAIEGDDE